MRSVLCLTLIQYRLKAISGTSGSQSSKLHLTGLPINVL